MEAETEVTSKRQGLGFIVRRARPEDLPKVIMINKVTLPEHYPEWFWREHLEKWGEAFFVAEVDGEVVGYVMTRVEYGPPFVAKGLIVKKGHIVSIAVLEGYRRRGIGRALMEAAMEALKTRYGCKEVYLEVRVSNNPAIRLYEKLGFKKVKVLHMYYLDGEDAYLMAREL
ncbi:ribosomal protein S18-alanine N-acetyltransferase [Hyperthermus butylicus]|uniref:N-alpha-acetyltransferase n=1 Tax=Hyperthermus butylicus (strain DSM 5456 / JCM 9403 / PLM1-5) TaxID=415426 RepID=A2BLH0_HYPBU|nr:ribosomal protein S18-alanine N-acetyltransferase [Hyperthermus butylicus]ABM80831.1 putative Acetyltransferase [Hyperthermus butylicus DSM 5456]